MLQTAAGVAVVELADSVPGTSRAVSLEELLAEHSQERVVREDQVSPLELASEERTAAAKVEVDA